MNSIYTMTDAERARDIKRSVATLVVGGMIGIAMLAVTSVGIAAIAVSVGSVVGIIGVCIRVLYTRHCALLDTGASKVIARTSHIVARTEQVAGQAVEAVAQAARTTAYQIIVHALARARARLIAAATRMHIGLIAHTLLSARTSEQSAAAG